MTENVWWERKVVMLALVDMGVEEKEDVFARSLTDDKVIQHFVLKRNIPTNPTGLWGRVRIY